MSPEIQRHPELPREIDGSLEGDFHPSLGSPLEERIGRHLRMEDARPVLIEEVNQEIFLRRLRQAVARAMNSQANHLPLLRGQRELNHLARAAEALFPVGLAVPIL